MAVQYSSDKGWTTWIDDFRKKIPEASKEANDFFKKISDLKATLTSENIGKMSESAFNDYIKNNNLADESLIKFLKDSKQGTKDLASYQEYLKNTGKQTSMFADLTQKAGNVVKGFGAALASMAVMWAIGEVVSIAVKAIDDYVNRVEKIKQAASDAADRIDTLSSSLKSNQKTVSDSAKRFAELAQGIDSLTGKNISLSDSDYEEFLSISNDLAEIFPMLSRNYDENGNAIVDLSGNVDTIVGSLQNLIDAQRDLVNAQIADELPTVFKGASVKSDEYKDELDNLEQQRDALVDSLGNVQSNDFADNFIDGISKRWLTVSSDNLEVLSQMKSDYEKLLKEANIDFETLTPNYKTNEYGQEVPVDFTFNITSSDEDIENAKKKIDKGVQELAKQYEKDITELNTDIANTTSKNKSNWSSLSGSIAAWLSSDSSYKVMSDSMQSSVQQIINNLDWSSLDFSSWDDAEAYVQDNIIGLFEGVDGSNIAKQFGKVFDLKTQFQNGEVTLDEYLKGVTDFKTLIDGFDDNTKKSIDLIFNVSSSDGSSVDTMLQGVEDKLQESAKDEIGQLSLGDLEIAFDKIDIPQGTLLSWEELLNLIKEYKESVKAAPSFISEFTNLPTDKVEEYISLVKSGNINEGTISSFSELNALMKETDMSAEDAAKALKDYADGYKLSTDLTASIQAEYDLLKDVADQYKETGIIGLSSLESIANTYPQLRNAVNEYTQGLISADDMIAQLQTAYENDANAYKTAMAYKLSGNEEFFTTIFNNNQSLFDDLSKAYGLDVSNWKTMAQAKAEIDQKLIQSLSSAWSKYYNIVFDSVSGLASLDGMDLSRAGSHGVSVSEEQQKAWSEATKQANKYNQIIKGLNEAASIQIDPPDFGGIGSLGSKSGSGSKDKKDTKKPFDWIARGTKVLQDEYAKLEELASKDTIAYLGLTQEEFDNAKSIFDNGLGNSVEGLSQLQSYADKAGLTLGELYTMIQSGAPSASKENALQSMLQMQTDTLLPQYQREVEAYSKAYEDALKAIPSEYKDKIENGGVDIETLPSDLAEKVQAAIDANDKLKSSEKQLADGEAEHIETIKKLHENRIDAIDVENEKLQQSNKIIKSQMELMEARGKIVDADFYKRQMKNNDGLISNNQESIAEWESEMADLRAANFDTNSKEYKELKAKVRAAKNEIQVMKLEQEEFNQTLKQMPIDHLSTIISMYQDINTAISNWGSEVEASGKKLDGDYYQKMISNGDTIIKQYQKQANLIKDVMDEYETGSDNWQQLYSQLQSINSEMSTMVKNLRQYNEELLRMPLENIDTFSSGLQKVIDGLNGVRSEQDTVISAVTGALKEQIDLLNEQKEVTNKEKEAAINALKEKLSLLEKENEYRKLQYDLEQKQFELERARNQRTNLVVRNGVADYEKDVDAERKAQEALLDSQYNLEKYNLQEQIDKAQESLDAYNNGLQEQIDALQKISDKWSEISTKITQAQNEAKADEILGSGWKDKVLSGNDAALFNTFSGMYQNTSDQLQAYQKQADTTNNINAILEDYIASYKAGEITYEQAMTKINGLLSQLNQSMSASSNLQNIYDYLGTVNGVGADAGSILKGIQDGLAVTADELVKSLEQYNKNSGMISEYSSSWEQLTDNVKSMLDVLKEVRDNLRDAEDDSDDDDDEPYDKSRGKGWGIGDVNNGPGVYADGIKNGTVGKSSDSEREKMLKYLATNELKDGEVPILAHTGEAILNDSQQNMLMKNLGNAASFMPNLPDYSNVLNGVKMVEKSNTPTIHFNGGITIEKCDTPDEFARGIMDGKLALALGQRLGRR
ncbi:hypothetical protein [Lacrimispora indolis]|uniref:hypothetical protein n=1 Tax=Lacrimispora indolis TaxID=69825 RepID=UPI0004153A12|nr:hypothetical protein [[Clostridium] methoxybenzovorans]